jgi:hypothetical protein
MPKIQERFFGDDVQKHSGTEMSKTALQAGELVETRNA